MTAEFQVLSPLVPTRESYYVRYCKQHAEGTWAVVDVSLDNIRPSPTVRCRIRPSGCLIQEMPNGYSKVKQLFSNDHSQNMCFLLHSISNSIVLAQSMALFNIGYVG